MFRINRNGNKDQNKDRSEITARSTAQISQQIIIPAINQTVDQTADQRIARTADRVTSQRTDRTSDQTLVRMPGKVRLRIPESIKRGAAVLLSVLVVSFVLNTVAVYAHRAILQKGIAEEVLRFHVLANSDSQEDQEVKLKVRDAVLEYLSAENDTGAEKSEFGAEGGQSEREVQKQFIAAHLEEIEMVADQVLELNGMPYRATAEIEQCYFPDRTYGDCTFPAGWYEALRICLGEAEGHNWWCVLYPKLCFSDYLHAVVEDEQMQELEEVLTEEEYESLLRKPGEWKIAFRWF